MYLVDTNVVSEARRGSPQAISWLRSFDPAAIYLSVVTLGEIMRGIIVRQRTDPTAAGHLAAWLQRLRHDHADRILPVSDEVALAWGRLAAQRTRGEADGLIAATAIVHNLSIVTRNLRDFDDIGLNAINPWDC